VKKLILGISLILVVNFCSLSLFADDVFPIAWWKFDEGKGKTVIDIVSKVKDEIRGNFNFVSGSSGSALKFDGFSTCIVREAKKAPHLRDAFTIEAWIAIGAYPWNWCPIVSQEKDEKSGYYFGVDSQGKFGLRLAVEAKWLECKSKINFGYRTGLGLKRWYHLAGVYDPNRGITIYLDGKPAGTLEVKGKVDFAPKMDLLIGRNYRKMVPTHPVRSWATFPTWYSFDGIIDEIKIYDRALTPKEIAREFQSNQPENEPEFARRAFPNPPNRGQFGAYYTKLHYYQEWDALWRMGEYSDIVVQFDEYPIQVIFWRGTRYSPCWVTENHKWMADQSLETSMNWGKRWDGPTGCCEHMSDIQCRYSHVRLIENNDARVVVHWRYALVDVKYRQSHVDKETGWGDFGDEYYTIYPDGVGVRKVKYWSSEGEAGWQETIFLNQPGTKPEDNCELEAITLVNLEGKTRSYSWEHGYPKFDLPKPIIQMTNLKAKYRPFMIFMPGSEMSVFNVEVRPEYSHFPWWNHWPVAQIVSDGRHAQAPDRAAHSSLVWGGPEGGAALYGMTNNPAISLLSLAKSWISPPELKVFGSKFKSDNYDYTQRAYVINCKETGNALEFELKASEDSPIVNPAFVIKNWGDLGAKLEINGRLINRGKNFRFGHRHRVKGTDLIIWIKYKSMKPVKISVSPTVK